MLAHYYGTQVADGFFHSFSGWVIYVVAFVMLFGVGVLLDRAKPKNSVKKHGRLVRASATLVTAQAEGVE